MEVFYVLIRPYKMARIDAASLLLEFLSTGVVHCSEAAVVFGALSQITSQKIAFGDAYLAETAAQSAGASVASFDQGLRNFKDLSLYDWSRP